MKGETETVKLKTEGVTAYGEPLTELKLREPTGEDLAKCGFPFSFKISGEDREMLINTAATVKLTSQCANIPIHTVKQLRMVDIMQCFAIFSSFLGDAKSSETPVKPAVN